MSESTRIVTFEQPAGAPLVQMVGGVAGHRHRRLHEQRLDVRVNEGTERRPGREDLLQTIDVDLDGLALDLPDDGHARDPRPEGGVNVLDALATDRRGLDLRAVVDDEREGPLTGKETVSITSPGDRRVMPIAIGPRLERSRSAIRSSVVRLSIRRLPVRSVSARMRVPSGGTLGDASGLVEPETPGSIGRRSRVK